MAKRADIIRKTFSRIDEIYPDDDSMNMSAFNIENFIDDAARWVVMTVPVHALGQGEDFSAATHTHNDNGSGTVALPQHFLRLISFQMSDWSLPLIGGLYQDDARYRQQNNSVLRGTPYRPVVFVCDGGHTIEYYTSATGDIKVARCFAMEKVGDDYPDRLEDITAWKTAELVLSAMNDINAVQICQNNIKDLLQLL